MTRDELLEELRSLQHGDPEDAHQRADLAVLIFINDPEIMQAFDAIPRWYA